jgi:hypothetical protein
MPTKADVRQRLRIIFTASRANSICTPPIRRGLSSTGMFACQQVGFIPRVARPGYPIHASGVKKRPRCRIHQGQVNLSAGSALNFSSPDQIISFHASKTAGSAAHLDRSRTPAIPGMHAPLHHVAAANAIIGIVVGIIVIIVAIVGVRVA